MAKHKLNVLGVAKCILELGTFARLLSIVDNHVPGSKFNKPHHVSIVREVSRLSIEFP
jgi:hypothetical protein